MLLADNGRYVPSSSELIQLRFRHESGIALENEPRAANDPKPTLSESRSNVCFLIDSENISFPIEVAELGTTLTA